MNEHSQHTPGWSDKLIADFKRDPKKTAVMSVLLIVAAVMGVRMLSGGTSNATAALVKQHAQTTSAIAAARESAASQLRSTQKDKYLKDLSTRISRDIFSPDAKFFPQKKNIEPVRVVATSTSAPVDAEAELVRQLVRAEASSLNLDSTMVGRDSLASINGKILHVGQEYSGWQIKAIASRSCTVSKQDVTVVLEIKN